MRDRLCGFDDQILCANGFDDAIIGVVFIPEGFAALYDRNKCIEILINEGLSEEDAIDHFEFNVAGSYVGPKTPVFVELP